MGVKHILYIILFVLPIYSYSQDSTRFSVHTLELNTGEPLPSQRVQLSFQDSVFLDSVTNENGVLELSFLSNRFVEDSKIGFGVVYQDEKLVYNWNTILWKSNYDFYQEFHIGNTCPGGSEIDFSWMFNFKENQYRLDDSVAQNNFEFIKDIMEENPRVVISAKALYSRNESREIANKRLNYFKSQMPEYNINPERVIFQVMSPDFEIHYWDENKEEMILLNRNQADNSNEIHKKQFQRILIEIVSWDYKANDE